MRDGGGVERPLSLASDALDGAVGETSVYPHPATPSGYASTSVPDGSTPVRQRGWMSECVSGYESVSVYKGN